MFRHEFRILCGLTVVTFLIVASAGVWVGHTLREDADRIAIDTLPDLVDAGTAMALTQDNWLRVQLMSNTRSAAERVALIKQIQANSNEGLWRDYGQGIYGPEEQREYRDLLTVRSRYLQQRDEFFALVQEGHSAEAKEFLERELAPAYESYREDSRKLFEYNAEAGRERTAKVIWISRAAPVVMGVCGAIVFAFGFGVGLRGAFVGLRLVSRRSKTWNV